MRRVLSQLRLDVPSRSRFWLRFASSCVAWVVWLAPSVAGAATFTAALDRDTITLGESATLSLTFAEGIPQHVPAPPAIPNLQIGYAGESSQFTLGPQGGTTVTRSYNFTVTPVQAGEFSI